MTSTYPFTPLKDKTRKVHGASSDLTRCKFQEAVIKQADFEKVLGEGTRLDVVIVGLRYPSKEIHRIGVAKVVVQGGKDEAFCLENLLF